MTATREHRNAAKVEKAIDAARMTLAVAEDVYDDLSSQLPDDFSALAGHFENARTALNILAVAAEA